MSLGNVSTVIFDLDETLIDAEAGLSGAHMAITEELTNYLEKNGIKIDHEFLFQKIKTLDDKMNLLVEYDRDKWWQILLEELNIKLTLEQKFRRELTNKYWSTYATLAEPYDDTIPILRYLKDKRYLLGLITDTDGTPGIKKSRIEQLSIYKIFDATIIAGEDTQHTKPSPEPYLKIAKLLDVSPEYCIFIGDKPHTDIKGALKAGMKSILIQRRKWDAKLKDEPTIVIENLSQIKSFL